MKEIIKLGIILLLICTISATLLGLTNELTIGRIIEQRELQSQMARIEVLSIADDFIHLDEEKFQEILSETPRISEVFVGLSKGEVIGYVIKSTPNGFNGSIEVITGITLDGKISGVRIGSHAETPGLGANAALAEFYEQYNDLDTNKSIDTVKTPPAENQIQAISGATITSQAITDGVDLAVIVFDKLK